MSRPWRFDYDFENGVRQALIQMEEEQVGGLGDLWWLAGGRSAGSGFDGYQRKKITLPRVRCLEEGTDDND